VQKQAVPRKIKGTVRVALTLTGKQ
jgi:hypothetical protein